MAGLINSDWVVLTLDGELDMARIEELDAMSAIAVKGEQVDVIVDLTNVTFADSSAVSWMIRLQGLVDGLNGRLRVVIQRNSPLIRLLSLTGLEGHFIVFPTRIEAEQEISVDAFDAVDQLLAILADPDAANRMARFSETDCPGRSGDVWDQATQAGYAEWTGLAYRLTNKGRARGRQVARNLRSPREVPLRTPDPAHETS